MGVALVCILPEGQFPGTDVANVVAGNLTGHPVPGLTVWVRSTPHPPTPTLEEISAHHRIVADAWERRPAVLPVRFGQWFATLGELTSALEPNLERYAGALERTAGTGEFSVRIQDPALPIPGAPPTGTGTEYLRAAAARERARREASTRGVEVAAELRGALGGLVIDERVDPLAEPRWLAVATHLVRRRDEEEYRAAADRFAALHGALRFVRTGPWPPWSFTA